MRTTNLTQWMSMEVPTNISKNKNKMDSDNLTFVGAVRQPKKYSSEAFSEAMTKILGSTLTGSDKRVSLTIYFLEKKKRIIITKLL